MMGYRSDGTKLGFQKGNNAWKNRKPPSQEARKKMGEAWSKVKDKKAKYRKISQALKGKSKSKDHKLKLKWSLERRRKFSEQRKGSSNPAWIDGRKKEHRRIRHSLEYRLWRDAVFTRDNWTCIFCKVRGGVRLEADHIKPFALYPELRFAIDNGRTLCIDCHRKTDNYGGRIFR